MPFYNPEMTSYSLAICSHNNSSTFVLLINTSEIPFYFQYDDIFTVFYIFCWYHFLLLTFIFSAEINCLDFIYYSEFVFHINDQERFLNLVENVQLFFKQRTFEFISNIVEENE